MKQTVYCLSELIDIAFRGDEGIETVNFNVLRTILQTIVTETKIGDFRPCNIQTPLLASASLTRAKLLGMEVPEKQARMDATEAVPSSQATEDVDVADKTAAVEKGEKEIVSLASSEEIVPSEEESKPIVERRDSAVQTGQLQPVDSGTTTEEPGTDEPISQSHGVDAEPKVPEADKTPIKSGRRRKVGPETMGYTNLENRVFAAEEGLNRLSNIVDMIADKMKKGKRREGGPSSEELEAIDERLLELEEALAELAADHALLMDINERLSTMLKEFEAIKALGALLEQMKLDISMKADKEETCSALALKADLQLVTSKVDQLEFETATEELGEAIGLLGLKFTNKNDEWEERAAEIWRGIDSKMTRDVFEAAREKIESRLYALMHGLCELKRVVQDLLYPEASGVTRCILCRRPACISGMECYEFLKRLDSPKRPLSARNAGDGDDPKRLRKDSSGAISEAQKLDTSPPYSESRKTIIRVPYSSYSNTSSVDEKRRDWFQMQLKPVDSDREFAGSDKNSQIPKLPVIDGQRSKRNTRETIVLKNKSKAGAKEELFYTKRMMDKRLAEKEKMPSDEVTTIFEGSDTETASHKRAKSGMSSKSSTASVDLAPDPATTVDEFTPARLMLTTSRRGILLSPKSPKEDKNHMTLAPLRNRQEISRRNRIR